MIKFETKYFKNEKTNKESYFLNVYFVYSSGKRFKLCSCFINKNIYDALKGAE